MSKLTDIIIILLPHICEHFTVLGKCSRVIFTERLFNAFITVNYASTSSKSSGRLLFCIWNWNDSAQDVLIRYHFYKKPALKIRIFFALPILQTNISLKKRNMKSFQVESGTRSHETFRGILLRNQNSPVQVLVSKKPLIVLSEETIASLLINAFNAYM